MKVSAQYAQEHLPDLLTAIDTGEEVELTRPGQSSVRLVLVESAPPKTPPTAGKRILGAGVGEMHVPSLEEWKAMDAEMWRSSSHDPLVSEDVIWTAPERPRSELFGSLKGTIKLSDDWDSPETNKEIEDLFENSEVSPDVQQP